MKTPQDHTSLPRPEQRYRARELGVPLGRFRQGKWNAITDVEGVLVGHSTIIRGAGPLRRGKGPVRTGVTAILPNEQNVFEQRLIGGGFVLNGAGEVSGMTQLIEWGLVETPIFLTNTLSVGQVSDAAVQWMVDQFPGIGGEHDVLIPLVGECDDSWLNDVAGRHVLADNVLEALHTAGVLVMSNFGHMRDLRIAGFPVGPVLEERYREIPKRETSAGSIIAVLATDAPLNSHQLGRVSKRVALGIGRAGSIAAHGSGEIILAFSTANEIPRTTSKMIYHMKVLLDQRLNPVYEAAIEATEEAILNSLCMAREMDGANGNFVPALPLAQTKELLERWRLKPREKPAPSKPPAPAAAPPGPVHEPADPPTVAEAPPSAVRGAEGMAVPLQPPRREE